MPWPSCGPEVSLFAARNRRGADEEVRHDPIAWSAATPVRSPVDASLDLPGDPDAIGIELSFPHLASTEIPLLVVAEAVGARFSVGDVRIPSEAMAGRSIAKLDADVQWATTSRIDNGDVLGYRAVTVAGSPGREVVVDSNGSIHRIRNVVLGDRLVTLSVSGPAWAVGSAEADRFLHSVHRDP